MFARLPCLWIGLLERSEEPMGFIVRAVKCKAGRLGVWKEYSVTADDDEIDYPVVVSWRYYMIRVNKIRVFRCLPVKVCIFMRHSLSWGGRGCGRCRVRG